MPVCRIGDDRREGNGFRRHPRERRALRRPPALAGGHDRPRARRRGSQGRRHRVPGLEEEGRFPRARPAAALLRHHLGLDRLDARQLHAAQAGAGRRSERALPIADARPGRHRLRQPDPGAPQGRPHRPRRHRGLAPPLRPLRLLGRRCPPLHPPRHAGRHPRLRSRRAPGRRDRPPARPRRGPRRHPRHVDRPGRGARGRPRHPRPSKRSWPTRTSSARPRSA